jgi:hypothetical protein
VAAKSNIIAISLLKKKQEQFYEMTPDEGQGYVAVTALPLIRLCLHCLSPYLERRIEVL